MSNQKAIILADLTEMVFEDREQRYGAYQLRKNYSRNALTGLAIASLAMLSLSFFSAFSPADPLPEISKEVRITLDPTIVNKEIDKKELKVEKPKIPDQPKIRTVVNFPPTPVPEDLVEDSTIHSIDTLKLVKNFGTKDSDGEIDEFFVDFDPGDEEMRGLIEDGGELDPNDFQWVEEEPKPVNMGDIGKLTTFPMILKETQFEGTVVLRILVDEHGKYQKHIVLNSAHPLFTKEVEKHIHLLQFTPAIQGNKPIPFWVNIPFAFRLVE